MSVIFSLQGCMAAGKTTAARYAENNMVNVLMDLGADEIEFFTLFYPKSMGFAWDTEKLLKNELAALRECIYTGVLFLSVSPEVLINNKQMDTTRKRGFFDYYLSTMYNTKKEWFLSRQQPKTDFINIDGMTKEQVGQQVITWIKKFL